MIAERLISVVMTALVLACPFLEYGACCDMCPTQHSAVDCCHAAQDDLCDHDDKTPCNHNCPHESSDKDCLCKGAIVPAAARCPDSDRDLGLVVVTVADGLIAPQLAANHAKEPALAHGSHFPPLLSGRDICTLVGSQLL